MNTKRPATLSNEPTGYCTILPKVCHALKVANMKVYAR